MPTFSKPNRIDDEIDSATRGAAKSLGSSVAEQGWSRSYDTLTTPEQALVRKQWSADIDQRLASLDLSDVFAASGHIYAELDSQGQVVKVAPSRRRGHR